MDDASCAGRAVNEPQEISSVGWPASIDAGGIFSRDASQNPWAAANFAYVAYCSSDAWMGDAEAYGFQFRGQAILAATLDELRASRGLGDGARLLLGGCSAGARGAMANLDAVAAALPGIEVRGLLDSGLWVDASPADPSTTESLLAQTAQVASFVNAGALVPAECAAAYPGEEYKCLFGQYRMPFVTTPYFLSESQFDSFQMLYNCGGETPRYGFQVTWADTFQTLMRSVVSSLPTPSQAGSSGVFSSTCLLHCVTNGPDWWTVTVNGQSLASAMAAWYFQNDAPQQPIVSECTGWPCNGACKGEEQPALRGGSGGAPGGGGLRAPPAPLKPNQYVLNPSSSEPWQEQLAQARRAAAAGGGAQASQASQGGDHGAGGGGAGGQMGTGNMGAVGR